MPNAEWDFNPLRFAFRLFASKNIKKGDEIFIPYTDPKQQYEARKEVLGRYDFVCSCPKCVVESGGDEGKGKAK